jgi:hypothetical protein
MLRRMIYWKVTGQPMTIRSGSQVSFYAQPDEFVAMAQAAGLELVRSWQHEDPSNRCNYLFRKGQQHSKSEPKDQPDSSHSAA